MTLAIASLAVSHVDVAEAAGLGRLTVQSALGQPLRAEVEVTSLSKDESQSLAVKLAPPEAFRQAGLEYMPALSSLRFAVDRRPDGRAIIRITSPQPLNEPFVDLLLELNWATGKFVREYTFLLDPPEMKANRDAAQDAVSPVVPATTVASAPVAQAPAVQAPVAPVPAVPAPAVAPQAAVQPLAPPPAAESRPAASAPAPASQAAEPARPSRAAQRAAAAQAASAAATPAAVTSSTPASSVDVHSGDTLASIAQRVKPDSVSLDQAMIAIYRANKSAFFGSVHQLKSNVTLSVPDSAAMSAIDPTAARNEVRMQARVFNQYKARLAGETTTVGGSGKTGQSASGSVSAGVKEAVDEGTGGDQLRLSRSAEAGGNGSSVAKGGAAAERRVATQNALNESRSRIGELEKNVADLQNLLALKNKQLADVQAQLEAGRSAPAAAGAISRADSGQPAQARAEPPKAEPPAAQPAKPEAPKAEPPKVEPAAPVTGSASPAETAPAAAPAAVETPAASAPAPAATSEAPRSIPPAPAVPAAATEEPGLLSELTDNPMVLPGIGALALLLIGGGWLAMRRRKKVEKFEDSLIATDGFTANSLFGSTGGASVDTNQSMFTASRETSADVHSTEVDPIAEAEVYIAYGRETQAEEILKEALKKQPERQAIRLKLLEIYAGRKDVGAFNAVAEEMYAATGGQNEEWPKVITLGLSVDPDNSLYTGKASADASTFPAPSMPMEDDSLAMPSAVRDDEPLDLSQAERLAADQPGVPPSARPGAVSGAESMAQHEPFDFDLNLDETLTGQDHAAQAAPAMAQMQQAAPARQPKEARQAVSELAEAIEGKFELPTLDLPVSPAQPSFGGGGYASTSTTASPRSAPGIGAGVGAGIGSGGGSGNGHANAPIHAEDLADMGEGLKIDLPALEELDSRRLDDPAQAMDLSAIGLDLQPTTLAPPPNADAARWQEMATKLDLASAYEEIGDKEGARELLDEVIKGGDSDQQQRARAMLSKLS